MTDEILFDVRGGLGLITLNRPQALNALNLPMIRAMAPKMIDWAKDPNVRAVAIMGAGDRAFCSGGDVKAVAIEAKDMQEGKSDGQLCRDFFREEYILNHLIQTFPKPYISLINGIVMGGGKGLSAHGSHRVVSENVMFAMPETNIGFFPDVGGGYFLPRCPGQTGLYLALTSKRIKAADTLYISFATHHVELADFPALIEALEDIGTGDKDEASQIIEDFAKPAPGISEIAPHRSAIDNCFGFDHLEDIVKALQADGSDWAKETLAAMNGMSPTSMKIALRQIRLGASLDFAKVMTMEYRLSQHLMQGHDFYEGIRAALIDKDRQPKWQPAHIEDVSDQAVENCFKSLGDQDLVLKPAFV